MSSRTHTATPARSSRRTPAPFDEREDGHVVARCGRGGVTRLKTCSWAPPLVPGREQLDDADALAARGQRQADDRLEARVGGASGGRAASGRGAGIVVIARRLGRRGGRGCAGPARRRRPTRTCTARRRGADRPGTCRARSRAARAARAARRPARGRARRDRRRRCSTGPSRRSRNGSRRRCASPPTVRKPRWTVGWPLVGAAAREQLEQPPDEDAALVAAGRRPGRGPRSPQRRWCRSMNASRSATGSVDSTSSTAPAASARRTLRRISWRSFLPSVGEEAVEVGALREPDDRADVLALDVERPALGRSRACRTRSRARRWPGRRGEGGEGRSRPTGRVCRPGSGRRAKASTSASRPPRGRSSGWARSVA